MKFGAILMLFTLFCGSKIPQDGQPVFKGGMRALNSFLSNNLIYPEYSRQNCLSGTIQVSFTLDKSGKVMNAKVQRGYGIDLDDEALRIVRLTSGKWDVPASYDNETPIILPVTFENPEGYRCTGVSAEQRQKAILAYQSRESLELAVTNYYKNKQNGKVDSSKQNQIEDLKTQLGINDEYIGKLLKQAQQKIRQKDLKSACADLKYIKNLGSNRADKMLAQYCR